MTCYFTCCMKILFNVSSGSVQKPGWTLDVCKTVLRVAVSHRKRDAGGNAAMGLPHCRLPSQICLNELR
jgi:hypothetical protein